jgi:hypothetical protein
MGMDHPGHPDGDYQTVNKVQVLDPPRAIGWLTGQEKAAPTSRAWTPGG